jgi:hypothetical protein
VNVDDYLGERLAPDLVELAVECAERVDVQRAGERERAAGPGPIASDR